MHELYECKNSAKSLNLKQWSSWATLIAFSFCCRLLLNTTIHELFNMYMYDKKVTMKEEKK